MHVHNENCLKINVYNPLKPQLKLYALITGLSIDYGENKLYWISSGNGTISRCNLDGGNLEIIESMKEDLTKATALTIMGKSIDYFFFNYSKLINYQT